MTCSKSSDPSAAEVAAERQAICDTCPRNQDGVCELVELKHPGKAVIKDGVSRLSLRCPLGKWEAVKTVCQCNRLAIIPEHQGVCFWCQNKRNNAAKNGRRAPTNATGSMPARPRVKRSRRRLAAERGVARAFRPSGDIPNFITLQQRYADTLAMVSMIPPEVDTIVGVARSGLSVANDVAMLLHKPLLILRQTLGDIVEGGNGWRLSSTHMSAQARHVAVIDDTVMTGNSLRSIDPLLSRFESAITAALYVNPMATTKPDRYVHELPAPHLLEWNLPNSVYSRSMALDFDGILCRDCPREDDDDGPRYLDFIENAMPLYMFRREPIPLIVTARIEKYREPTEQWLADHGMRCDSLVMHPATTLAERQHDDIAAYKARHFAEWTKRARAMRPLMFVESEDRQARRIHELSGRMTVCPATATCYGQAR